MPIKAHTLQRPKQRGAALLLAIIFAALLLLIASQLTWFYGETLVIKQQNQRQLNNQAYVNEAVMLFNNQLRQAYTLNPLAYPPSNDWGATQTVSTPQGHTLQLALVDGSAWVNSNKITDKDSPSARQLAYHQRLLKLAGINPSVIDTFLNSLIDWIDPNDIPINANGAEAEYYRGNNSKFLPANNDITQPFELCQIRALPAEDCPKLQQLLHFYPHINQQPAQTDNRLNINSASELAIAALHPTLTLSSIAAWQQSKPKVISNTTELWLQAPFSTIPEVDREEVEFLVGFGTALFIGLLQINYNEPQQTAKASDIARFQLLLLRNSPDGSAKLVGIRAIN